MNENSRLAALRTFSDLRLFSKERGGDYSRRNGRADREPESSIKPFYVNEAGLERRTVHFLGKISGRRNYIESPGETLALPA